ncbi:MAG: hypothetical protein F6J94_21975 [Moorea sp. SIO1F2]|uniref:hypothetical protein n=1 Tax=Moorena sp. SIO1F2 TaxID=2607819 RepID=UPI0013B80F53|nr:hypothetical protein [Moorena sp. SIO1F2]NET84487.1 hypothetical protein [Moorena sp. SIO1F2]
MTLLQPKGGGVGAIALMHCPPYRNCQPYRNDSRFPIPDSRFPNPSWEGLGVGSDSRFPIPDSRFPIPDSTLAAYNLKSSG